MPYPQTRHSTASIALSTALQDKDGTYNRLRNIKPITAGSGDPLNRTGHVVAESPGTHFTSRTFKLRQEPPKQRGALFYTYDAALRNTNANHYTHSKPKPHQGHTITIVVAALVSYRFAMSVFVITF